MKKFNEIYEEVGLLVYMAFLLIGMFLVPFFGTAAWVSVLIGITGICESFATMNDKPIRGIIYTDLFFAISFGIGWFLCPTDILAPGLLITALLLPIRMLIWILVWFRDEDENED